MSLYAIATPSVRKPSLIAKLLHLFHASRERNSAINELDGLTDDRLRDIGVERFAIASRIDTEMAKINLKRLGQIGLC